MAVSYTHLDGYKRQQYNLGLCYEYGTGVTLSKATAGKPAGQRGAAVPCAVSDAGPDVYKRQDYQIPPDQAAMFRGSYTAGSVAFLLLSTTLPAFCLLYTSRI